MIHLKSLLSLLAVSVVAIISYWLYEHGLLSVVIDFIRPYGLLPEFIAGFFYTSFLTTPIAVAMIFVLSRFNDPLVIAIVGGVGAVTSDLIILRFFRYLIFGRKSVFASNPLIKSGIKFLRGSKTFRGIAPFLGAAIIASPLPDEIGLLVLGLTEIKGFRLSLLCYVLNAVGIYLIALGAAAIP